jgi:hypothetical protein
MELSMLERAGVCFPDPRVLLRQRAEAYRRVVRLATRRVVLVVPRVAAGQELRSHPLWDEITARLGLDAATRATITMRTQDLLSGRLGVRAKQLDPLPLPPPIPEWLVELPAPPTFERHSASSLSSLLGCR